MYSKILISGRLVEPADDKPRSGVTLTLSSVKNSSVVLKHATYRCVTGGNGEYSFNAAPGTYAVAVSVYGAEPERVGQIRVYSDSLPGDLNTFLMAPGEGDLTPEIIKLVDSIRSEAVKAAESAKVSEQIVTKSASDVAEHAQQVASDKVVVAQKTTIATDAAATAVAAKDQTAKDAAVTGQNRQATETKAREAAASADEAKSARDSIVNDAADVRAKAKQVADDAVSVANNTAAVQRNTEQVAQNTLTVGTKAQQVAENTNSVSTNTLSVTQMRDEVTAKTAMAQGAADTATQKAASAAGHDAAAAEYARQAQEAAQATAGALIDGGAADLSAGVYPPPVQVSGVLRSTFWKVTKGGVVWNVDYGVGDTLIYTTSDGGSYYKIDNTESVTSVQGEKGAVTLTPEKIGAEAAGTSVALIQQHTSSPDPHVQYAKKTDVDASGTAQQKVSEHTAAPDPHVQYAKKTDVDARGTAQQKISEHTAAPDPHPKYALKSSLGSAAYKSTAGLFSSAPLMEQYYWDFRTIASYDVPFAFPIGVSAGISPASRVGASGDYVSMLSCIGYVDYSGYESMAQWFASNNLNGIGVRVPYPVSNGVAYFRNVHFRTTNNTTVDANGFIKSASPIARLYGCKKNAESDSEYKNSGCVTVNHEANGVHATREDVGVYRVTGSLGFATDGWYIETPADANGNKLLFVEYEQSSNGNIIIKTFTPDYSSGRCAAGEPKDIPDGRWIDLRLSMPEIAE